jgi:hypothetical protein
MCYQSYLLATYICKELEAKLKGISRKLNLTNLTTQLLVKEINKQ